MAYLTIGEARDAFQRKGFTKSARGVLNEAAAAFRSGKRYDIFLSHCLKDAEIIAGVKVLLDGVELTERELLKVLEKHGVRKFEPEPREKFDPNLHQAMYEVQDSALPAGTVAQVVQAGYMIGDRMLRPALVAVAKGGPKAVSEPAATADVDSPRPDPAG